MLLQQVAASQAPFFSNDIPGVLKVIFVVVLPTVLAIIGAVWKFMRGDLKDDINGLGTRMTAVATKQTTDTARIDQLERQRERDDEKFRNLDIGLAKVEQAAKSLQDQTTDGKLEIIAKINDMQVRVENRINETNVGMAEMKGEMRAFRQVFSGKRDTERGGPDT